MLVSIHADCSLPCFMSSTTCRFPAVLQPCAATLTLSTSILNRWHQTLTLSFPSQAKSAGSLSRLCRISLTGPEPDRCNQPLSPCLFSVHGTFASLIDLHGDFPNSAVVLQGSRQTPLGDVTQQKPRVNKQSPLVIAWSRHDILRAVLLRRRFLRFRCRGRQVAIAPEPEPEPELPAIRTSGLPGGTVTVQGETSDLTDFNFFVNIKLA
ncbi:hypothetical protein FPOAC1_005166 [Fusarium poae]|uniref:hypothetical protein n=1 Tax=Fusarium poae TaxID=36050 RepID=UPI001CEB75EE|nr:hypothetical protein FPOAC1_005166 [Fusarium poae]KAG8671908.1 hypothetical protein FPOAC1_005166 [Fusarium poae]